MSQRPQTNDIRIDVVSWTSHGQTLSALRREIFIEEQNVPEEDEWDDQDQTAIHLVAYLRETALGTLRLLPSCKLTRMAVVKSHRNRGIGSALILQAIKTAKNLQWPYICLDAQTQAIGFYEHFGFTTQGQTFLDAGIPHKNMTLMLD